MQISTIQKLLERSDPRFSIVVLNRGNQRSLRRGTCRFVRGGNAHRLRLSGPDHLMDMRVRMEGFN